MVLRKTLAKWLLKKNGECLHYWEIVDLTKDEFDAWMER